MSVFQPPPTFADPVVVDETTGKSRFNPVWLKWFVDMIAIINAAGGGAVTHNSLAGLQGGQANQYYHITAAQAAGVTGTVPLAKLTGAGANGSLTLVGGIITAKTDPT